VALVTVEALPGPKADPNADAWYGGYGGYGGTMEVSSTCRKNMCLEFFV
jgi:hypothetical protein